MNAIVYHRYGGPKVLEFVDVAKPMPGENEVLIRVRASSVNPFDWHLMLGEPAFARVIGGFRRPKHERFGVDLAGDVEAVGNKVSAFKAGDAVFGTARGAFGEYVIAKESAIVAKPSRISYEQAAAVPIAGLTAMQAVRNGGHVGPGQKVLINGAAGGVGTFAVQIARAFGAEVTGVCSTTNVQMVKSIGAAHVIDYTQEDFTRGGSRYDVIVDMIGNHSLPDCRRALTPDGTYVAVGGTQLLKVFLATITTRFARQRIKVCMAKARREDLDMLREMLANGAITPVIDRKYPLQQVPQALEYLGTGHARGKVVVTC